MGSSIIFVELSLQCSLVFCFCDFFVARKWKFFNEKKKKKTKQKGMQGVHVYGHVCVYVVMYVSSTDVQIKREMVRHSKSQ